MVGVFAFLFSLPVLAQVQNPHLARAQTLERELRYQEIPQELALALSQPGNSPEELVEIHRLWGVAHTVLNNPEQAREGFLRLLILRPDYNMAASVSPVFRDAFAKVKSEFEKEGKVGVTHAPPPPPPSPLPEGERPAPIPLEFTITDKFSRVAKAYVAVEVRSEGKTVEKKRIELTQKKRGAGEVTYGGDLVDPAHRMAGGAPPKYELSYALVLHNTAGAPVEPDPPLAATAWPLEGPAVVEEGGISPWVWVWAGVGTAVVLLVAGGVTVAVICGANPESCGLGGTETEVGWVDVQVQRGGAE
jgi:hypothetical protein